MDTQQHPGPLSKMGSLIGLTTVQGEDHRRSANAAMGAGIGQKIPQALEAQPERGGQGRLAHDRPVMQGVVKSKRIADHRQRRADR